MREALKAEDIKACVGCANALLVHLILRHMRGY